MVIKDETIYSFAFQSILYYVTIDRTVWREYGFKLHRCLFVWLSLANLTVMVKKNQSMESSYLQDLKINIKIKQDKEKIIILTDM